MSDKIKRDSPLVQSVLALDNYLAELERVGNRINSTDLTANFDIELLQKLMTRFAECGQGISAEISNLSVQLREAQSRAEVVAQGVGAQAELFNSRRNEYNEQLEKFRLLGEKVRELNAAIKLTGEDREKLTSNLPVVETQLDALIEELQELRKSARESHMRSLEKNAESLAQSLQNLRKKLPKISEQ